MVRQSTACNECRKLRRKCVRSSLSDNCDRCLYFGRDCTFPGEMGIKGNGNGIGQLLKEVDDLNLIISQLEEEMRVLGRGQQRQITQQQTEEGSPWTLTIHNGWLRIETGIRNISDLLNSQPIRYLSPRISTDQSNQDLVVHFNIGKTMRLRMLAMKLLVKCLNPKPNPTALLLPTSFLFNASVIIDTLVDRYFECYNFLRPFVHQPTFMKYYKELNSPLDSLLTLCICCVVCAAPCDHLPNSYQELRCMGDYFAGLAKSKILEQFDVPEKRLENVMAINMLGEYLYTVLNVSESLKLVSMGFQICHDLKPWYDKESKKPGVPSVECMLFSRHFPTMIRYNRLSDVIINRTQQLESVIYMEWLYLPDESDSIIDSVLAQNWHYQLTSHPVMAKIRLYRHHLYADSIHSLRFTDIILVDDIVEEWWGKLPAKFYICQDWLDTKQFKAGIDECTDLVLLLLMAYFLSYLNDIYATLLTPNNTESDTNSILPIVQERALKRALHCSQLAVCAMHRLTKVKSISPCHYMVAASECLSHTLDVLSILSLSTNFTVRKEARDMLREVMSRMDDMKLMRNHKVDPLKSPLLAGKKEPDFNNLNPSIYFNYPQPWYAAMYDICHYFEKMHISSDEETTLFSSLPLTFNN